MLQGLSRYKTIVGKCKITIYRWQKATQLKEGFHLLEVNKVIDTAVQKKVKQQQ